MREIKFRGKRVDKEEWAFGSLFVDEDLNEYSIQGYDYYYDEGGKQREPYWYKVISDAIGQYTGLKDKNGKGIYEGDIVKCVSELFSNFGKYPTGKYVTNYYEICTINGDYSYCFGTRKLNKDYVSKDILKSVAEKYYEVIGNIYENPDLLEDTHED